jgi:hypothetical protein
VLQGDASAHAAEVSEVKDKLRAAIRKGKRLEAELKEARCTAPASSAVVSAPGNTQQHAPGWVVTATPDTAIGAMKEAQIQHEAVERSLRAQVASAEGERDAARSLVLELQEALQVSQRRVDVATQLAGGVEELSRQVDTLQVCTMSMLRLLLYNRCHTA